MNVTFFGNRIFVHIINVRFLVYGYHPGSRWAINLVMDVLTGGRNKDLQRQREEGRVRTETKTGVPLPQARESRESPEAGKGEEGLSPGVFGGGMASLTP